ncbi:MAG: hypothetical protein ABSF69_02575 [Polyangiaceae bacterium]|jgi:hypothetical protein
MRTSIATVASLGAGASLVTAAFAGPRSAVSVAVAAALAAGNLWALARIVVALLPDDHSGPNTQRRGGWAVLAALKMGGLLAASWLLMRHGVSGPITMAIGFLSLPMGIAIGALVSDRSAALEDPR